MKALSILPALPTVGRIVHVTLSAELAATINRDKSIRGNACAEGDVFPLIIARVWPKENYSDGMTVNGQLILDGVGTFWMTSVHHGDEPGCWHWPHIEHAAELHSTGEVSAEEKSLREELIIQGNLAQERGFKIERLEKSLADATAQAEQYAERAARLQRENERLRAHETHLIQDRDRLIHGDLAKLHQQTQHLTAERDGLAKEVIAMGKDLNAAHERERRLTERLAAVASLVSDL